MATISSRVDDELKTHAEAIADSIGLSLSSVITVFLKRFVDEQGFPFDLKVVSRHQDLTKLSTEKFNQIVRQRVNEAPPVPQVPLCTYLDLPSNQLITQRNK